MNSIILTFLGGPSKQEVIQVDGLGASISGAPILTVPFAGEDDFTYITDGAMGASAVLEDAFAGS